ncbi:MAG: ferrous iron transport protein A [Acidaminococcus sp.]|jgi:ferrous iron transport protein A|nr:ferrous iron transport protein A [Acidaminococcus sp.]MCI2100558.1 ferrous iron transport protein A [Acidaminococcus sp.]MCI2114897.1 ferrous iron transport protein A [Acidaminococcus sp.]MCI2116981.1 ferrous iron transport protein A [Acidaminococcus sp.]
MLTLKDAQTGHDYEVVKLHGAGAMKRHIMDMGLTKGIRVHILRVAPLGDPVEMTVRGYELSLRKGDAEIVEIKEV